MIDPPVFMICSSAAQATSPVDVTARRSCHRCGRRTSIFPFFVHTVFQEYEETCLFTKHESLQGDSPRVHPNILKCSLHSLVTKGIRLVGFATKAMVCESPTHYLILNSLAFARGCVFLRSHFLILLLLIILISHHIHS